MKIVFNLDSQELFGISPFSFTADWDLPFIPRRGDYLSTGFLTSYIDAHAFYEHLVDSEKTEWVDAANHYMEEDGLNFCTAAENNLRNWLDELYIEVTDVLWSRDENGVYIEIFLTDCLK